MEGLEGMEPVYIYMICKGFLVPYLCQTFHTLALEWRHIVPQIVDRQIAGRCRFLWRLVPEPDHAIPTFHFFTPELAQRDAGARLEVPREFRCVEVETTHDRVGD